MSEKPAVGTIGWVDLTVPNADEVRDFYSQVVGWSASEVDMGTYKDYGMHTDPGGRAVAGVCHAVGSNAGLPAQWLIYVMVADLDVSLERCAALGGKLLVGPRDMGPYGKLAVIQDPAGAVMALMQSA